MKKPEFAIDKHPDLDQTVRQVLEATDLPDLVKQHAADKLIRLTITSLDTLHAGNQMPLMHASMLIVLASRYVDVKDVQKALEVLRRLPPSFYRQVLPKLMQRDEVFAGYAVKLANAIVAEGIVDVQYQHRAVEIQPKTGVA
jgi:hypothetical protein